MATKNVQEMIDFMRVSNRKEIVKIYSATISDKNEPSFWVEFGSSNMRHAERNKMIIRLFSMVFGYQYSVSKDGKELFSTNHLTPAPEGQPEGMHYMFEKCKNKNTKWSNTFVSEQDGYEYKYSIKCKIWHKDETTTYVRIEKDDINVDNWTSNAFELGCHFLRKMIKHTYLDKLEESMKKVYDCFDDEKN